MNHPVAVSGCTLPRERILIRLILWCLGLAALLAGGRRVLAAEVLQLNIARTNSNVLVTWTNAGAALERTLMLTGTWIELTGAISPFIVAPSNFASFFRLRGTESPPEFGFRYLAPTFTTSIGDPFGCGCTSPENPNSVAAGGSGQDSGQGSVLLHTGELTQNAVDLTIAGRGFDWRFARAYRSGMSYDGPLGYGWDFSYNRRLVAETNGNVLRVDGMGRVDRYTLNTNGAFDSPAGIYARLKHNLDGTYEERDRHGATNFYTTPDSLGVARLTRTSDRNANQMNFQYNPAGQLTNVLDTLARSITLRYDANGRLTNVTDFAARALRFAYDGNGNLISATSPAVTNTPNGNNFPLGKTTAYTYASGFTTNSPFNHNLLSVTAPNETATNGPARLVAQYDTNSGSTNADRLISLRLGGTNATGIAAGGTIFYTYASFGPAGSNDFASPVFQNTVTNRGGNVTQYRFNQLGNIVRSIQFTRGVRAGDPAGFTNTFAYNRDGETIARTNAELDSIDYTYDSGNPDRRQQGNLLQVRRLPGPRGGDQTQIITSQTFETNFNFLATSTDGRGNLTTHRYDPKGNRTNTVHRISSIVEDFEYNAFGQLTAHVLPDNGSAHRRRDTLSYYNSGTQNSYLQSNVVDSGGFNLTTTYEYDAVGNVVRTIDPRGNDTLFTVNALNQIVRRMSPEVLPGIRYEQLTWYDANNNVVREDLQNRDETGALQGNTSFTSISEFDILNDRTRLVQEKGSANLANTVVTYAGISVGLRPQFLTTEYQYDADDNLGLTRLGEATAGNDPFNTVQELWDERDLLFREVRAPGSAFQSTTQNDYDRNGNLTRIRQGLESAARTNSFTLDGFDRQTGTVDAMGNSRTNHFDANDNQTSERVDGQLVDVAGSSGNVRLSSKTNVFDAMDRNTRVDVAFFDTVTQTNIGDGVATTRFIYNDNSQLLATVDDNDHTNRIAYDTADRRHIMTDAKANTTTLTYDAGSNPIQTDEVDVSDVAGQTNELFVTRSSYDPLNRLIAVVDNLQNTNRIAYDSRDNRVLSTDARGNQTRQTQDGLNRLIQTTRYLTDTGDGTGTVTDTIDTFQGWDDSSRLISQTDDNTNTTAYIYDPLGRRIQTVYADGTIDSFNYDVHDNLITMIDANGSIVTTTFDLLNRATTNDVIRGAGVFGTTFERFQLDGLSRVVRAEDDDSIVTNRFDSLSHLTLETEAFSNGPPQAVISAYDGVGNLTGLVYPGGRTLVYSNEALNRAALIADAPPGPGSIVVTQKFIGPYRLSRRDFGNGTRLDCFYDGLRRLVQTRHYNVSGAFDLDNTLYGWDPVRNKIGRTNVLTATSEIHTYDSGDRLVVTIGSLIQYSLDGVGNRTAVSSGPGQGSYTRSATQPEPADFHMNQYTTTPDLLSEAFPYPDGNLAGNGAWTAHSAAGVVPVQLTNGTARLVQGAGSREDVNATLGTTMHAGQKLYAAFDLVNSGSNGTVYFAHFKDAGTTNFAARVFITSSGSGDFTVGLSGSSPTVATSWPSGLTFGTTYRIVASYEFNTGTVELWVNPSSQFSTSLIATGFANTAVSAYALRQATPSSGTSTQIVDNLCVSDSFTNALHCLPISRQYDTNGNLILVGLKQVDYDFRNRPIRMFDGGSGLTWLYYYDCWGRRIAREVSGNVTNHIYLGWQEIEEQDSSHATLATYVSDMQRGDLLQMVRGGQKYFFHADDLGSIVALSDNTGATVEQRAYADNGTPSPSSSNVGNPFFFTGQRYDGETGWYYCRNRYLDPVAGRFITRDPLGMWGDEANRGNAYDYVHANPTSFKDPLGLMSVCNGGVVDQLTSRIADLEAILNRLDWELAHNTDVNVVKYLEMLRRQIMDNLIQLRNALAAIMAAGGAAASGATTAAKVLAATSVGGTAIIIGVAVGVLGGTAYGLWIEDMQRRGLLTDLPNAPRLYGCDSHDQSNHTVRGNYANNGDVRIELKANEFCAQHTHCTGKCRGGKPCAPFASVSSYVHNAYSWKATFKCVCGCP